MNHFKFKLN